MIKRYVGMGDYEKIEVEILENGFVECAYDWDGGAHNPNRSRMTAREFLDNIPYDVQRLLYFRDSSLMSGYYLKCNN